MVNMPTVASDEMTAMLRAIADPTRRTILALLKEKGCCAIGRPTGMCACDVESRVGLSQPTVSHHMRMLTESGLVQAEKHEQWMWYRRNESAIRDLAKALREAL